MKALELQACSIALERFKSDEIRANLDNYHVVVRDHAEEFEVVFVPNQHPSAVSPTGVRTVLVGGATEYGPEVHYYVKKNTFEILRRHFAR